MSRCFPFPPPGYERKIKVDDPCLLKKDKHNEKNHKKEKKDKEKKVGKEKLGKERTDEKRKDKKAKNEKHRDKKDKERDLYKDKHKKDDSRLAEKRAGVPFAVHTNKFHEKSDNREIDENVSSGEHRVAGLSALNNGVPVGKTDLLASQTEFFNNIAGSVRRNDNEERSINNQLFERQKNRVVTGSGVIPPVDGKGKTNEKPAVVRKMDLLGVTGEVKFKGNGLKLPQKSRGPLVDGSRERKEYQPIDGRLDWRIVPGEVRSCGSAVPPNIIGVVKNKFGATVTEKEGDRQKEEKRKQEVREKEIRRENDAEKKNEEKEKATGDLKKHVQIPSKRDGDEHHVLISSAKNENKKDLLATPIDRVQRVPKPSSQGGMTLLGKRKDIGLNGLYDEQMTAPHKLARTTTPTPTPTHPLTENGRSLEPCQNSAAFARPPLNIKLERTFAPDETQRPPMNIEVDGNNGKLTDIKMVPITQSSRTISRAEQKSRVSTKPPHPDTKYLSQLISVPELDEWPEFDDQEWLTTTNSSQTRTPPVEPTNFQEEPTVWASTLWLEPVDVFALPYVIPL